VKHITFEKIAEFVGFSVEKVKKIKTGNKFSYY
jgi:hypothetical protein